jgi:phospholipid/cholesterol/gamma-HCH transport system ATP-binding protein
MSTEEAAVELRHVTKRFGSRPVLDDVSLTVAPGRSVCILGRTGTGKSVALKHVVGLLKPDVGQVLIEGEDITRMSSRELSRVRRRIGFLFQGAALFDSISVGENVAFPLQRHTAIDRAALRARVDDLLSEVVRLSALLSAPGVTYGARILRTSRPCNGSKPVIGQQDPKQADHDTQEQTHRMILNA